MMLLVTISMHKGGKTLGLIGEHIGVNNAFRNNVYSVHSGEGLLGLSGEENAFKGAFLPEIRIDNRVKPVNGMLDPPDGQLVANLSYLEAFDLQVKLFGPNLEGENLFFEFLTTSPDLDDPALIFKEAFFKRLHFLLSFFQLSIDGDFIREGQRYRVKKRKRTKKKKEEHPQSSA